MMGGWGGFGMGWFWMFFFFLIPLAVLVLLIIGGMALLRTVTAPQQAGTPSSSPPARAQRTCPNCQQSVQNNWRHYPYCGTELTAP
jgi:hypothetical protein